MILAAAGPAFCAGMDLAEMTATAQSENPLQQWHADAVLYRDLLETMLRFPKPIVAAVTGPAVAGGAGLVLACDVVVGTPGATFGLPEPRRGLVAGMVSPLLAFRVGAGWAANLLLTSRLIEAAEAHRIGLYHELIPEGLSFLQLWSAATFLRGVVEDLMGVQVRADQHAVRLAPQLPTGWEMAELERLSFGGHTITVHTTHTGLIVTHLSGPAPLTVIYQAPDGSEQSEVVEVGRSMRFWQNK